MIVIGAGRIGTGLAARGATLVDRVSGWEILDGPPGEPVILAVRNDDLLEVLPRIPAHRRADLVFVQNGALRELLSAEGLSEATRGVLYLLASRRGSPPIPGATQVFRGPRAAATVRWLDGIGLPSEEVDATRFGWFELQKLLWLAVNGPLCEYHGVAVGGIVSDHRAELEAVIRELLPMGRAAWGAEPDEGWVIDLTVRYSLAIPDYRASVKEWRWRNGWIVETARQHRIPTPLHDALLRRTDHLGG